MKLTGMISWLMGRVQKRLFPHLNQCFKAPLTAQEEHLVSILEVLQVEHYIPRVVTNYRWPGRTPFYRKAMARVFVAKALDKDAGIALLDSRLHNSTQTAPDANVNFHSFSWKLPVAPNSMSMLCL